MSEEELNEERLKEIEAQAIMANEYDYEQFHIHANEYVFALIAEVHRLRALMNEKP